ncbi:hypothetical protein REPUB_Repub13aG0151600 [Reevesia pubescens]
MDYRDGEKGTYCQEMADQEALTDSSSNLKPKPPSEKPGMETGDWRTQLQSNARQRIVNKILDTLKRHLPFSGQEGLNELRKIAVRFEEKMFIASTSQSDYLRRISLKLLTMDVKSQNTAENSGKSSNLLDSCKHFEGWQQLFHQNFANDSASTGVGISAGLPSALPSIPGSSQIPIPNVVDENPSKQNISDISQMSMGNPIGQDGSSSILPNSFGQIQGLQEVFSKQEQQSLQEQVLYQNQSPCQQQLQQALLKQKLQQQMPQALSLSLQPQHQIYQQNQLYLSQRTPKILSTSLDAAEQTGHATADDWQEEVHQKIKAMKEKYLPELYEMYQKIAAKLQQCDSLPQQRNIEQLAKLKIFKTMLDRTITFLSISKTDIAPGLKEKLDSYERQIINFVDKNKPRNPVSFLQHGQLSSPNVLSIQQRLSQIDLSQSDYNQMNPELQSMVPQAFEPISRTPQIRTQHQKQLQRQQRKQLQRQRRMQQQRQLMQQQYLLQLSQQQLPTKLKTHEFPLPHQMDDTDDVNMRQGIGANPVVLQENLATGQLPGYLHEQSNPGAQFPTSSPLLFQAPFVPPTATLSTPSHTPENFEKSIDGTSYLSHYRNINHQKAGSDQCPAPDTPGNELPHATRVTMAKPMSYKSLSASVVTMVDEAAAAVGEDLAAMRKRGLHARNFLKQTGMTGAEKIRCYMSAIFILVLIFWLIFFPQSPILKH